MSYILITNSDGVSLSLVHADDEGAYLAHHGVKNQRWGIRRFQNPDGSLTAAGKLRYSDGSLTEKGKRRMKTLQGKSDKLDAKKAKLNSPRKVNSKLANRSKDRGELIRRMQQYQQQELQRIQMQMQQQQELHRIQMQQQQEQQQELQQIQMQMQQDQQQLINNYNATPMFF